MRTQPLYDEIDELIAQMNEDLQNEEKNKKKKGRKKGAKNNH